MRAMFCLAFTTLMVLGGCTMPPDGGPPPNDNSGNDNETPPGPKTHVVSMVGIAFVPASLTVRAGDTVRWTNDESGAINHTVTSGKDSQIDDNPLLDSGNIAPGEAFEFTFDEAGEFVYFCEIHPLQMTNATITVED